MNHRMVTLLLSVLMLAAPLAGCLQQRMKPPITTPAIAPLCPKEAITLSLVMPSPVGVTHDYVMRTTIP